MFVCMNDTNHIDSLYTYNNNHNNHKNPVHQGSHIHAIHEMKYYYQKPTLPILSFGIYIRGLKLLTSTTRFIVQVWNAITPLTFHLFNKNICIEKY